MPNHIPHFGTIVANPTCGNASALSRLPRLLDAPLDVEDDLLWRTAGARFKALSSGRSSMFSAGSIAMRGTRCLELALELEDDRLRVLDSDGDGEAGRDDVLVLLVVLKKAGKRAWAICMDRTEDMVVMS